MTTTAIAPTPLEKARALWALGDYSAVAHEVIPSMGPVVVAAADIRPGQRVIDVAAGAGNAALPAARIGAQVVATDITPELLAVGRSEAERAGLDITWMEADAQALPLEDNEFDVALSTVGVMFAPDHQACAHELVRVVRPGGTIAIANWTPSGFVGQMLGTLKPYLPPPPAGARPGVLWGDEDHVRELFGDRVVSLAAETRVITVTCFRHPDEFRDFFKHNYGPTVAAYRTLAGDPDRAVELDRDLSALAARSHLGGDGLTMQWEYLLVTARVV